ncbi:uncharacterized protein ARMOST_17772 [Armillaria ostoyae]|uniref:Uncharacterized protein n=1 Tax=Armillaria ostoyae TaxID=47428 RepID=A0A284S029_ARMOS|nr:uncharacterized protein ARMOST_17772 [Armillaria ostoyae]
MSFYHVQMAQGDVGTPSFVNADWEPSPARQSLLGLSFPYIPKPAVTSSYRSKDSPPNDKPTNGIVSGATGVSRRIRKTSAFLWHAHVIGNDIPVRPGSITNKGRELQPWVW